MLTGQTIHINFDYALSETITVKLRGDISCNYVKPAYIISSLQVTKDGVVNNFPNELTIIPLVVEHDAIEWVHADSMRKSILSEALGKAIESTGEVSFLRKREKAA
ncbi:hypothetical protein I5907_04370 [Panacibacter sp. DH6]|uniref:Uncharacterized protein n=1 Tax=Panacibacter microcysteis TaxID=2793269 RepID=A0A931E548_9BACT|nr:hypothetical protein [Panacibacter microcysteis]MBG9375455.1 hypothetical protein [Panacibacter microcysteis]